MKYLIFLFLSFSSLLQAQINIQNINNATSIGEVYAAISDFELNSDFELTVQLFSENLESVKSYYIEKFYFSGVVNNDAKLLSEILELKKKVQKLEAYHIENDVYELRLRSSSNNPIDLTFLPTGFLKEYPTTRYSIEDEGNTIRFEEGDIYGKFSEPNDEGEFIGEFGFAGESSEEATLKKK